MLTIPPSVFDRTWSEDTWWWLSQACSQTLGPPWTLSSCLDDHDDYDDEHHIYLISKKSVLEKGDKKWKSPFNKYSDNVIARWRWQKIPSIEICGDALSTRWHNPSLSPSLTVMSLPRMRQGTLKGTWVKRGTRENVFFCGRNKLRQSARWEKGPDKHVLTPFYGGLYLRADPLGLCRLPLERSRPSFNGSCTDSINLTNWGH